ncbi:Alpha/Beta hydrolase protein [Absidia repens]|uniref:Alpha/Beta hydrolase protein n=1 Tax=Absidia repens TaxID=90262 RepID=A0A1X2IFJ6_9FUNG|nr:Alpha/Beta hydrolase protein [Absidia repens]
MISISLPLVITQIRNSINDLTPIGSFFINSKEYRKRQKVKTDTMQSQRTIYRPNSQHRPSKSLVTYSSICDSTEKSNTFTTPSRKTIITTQHSPLSTSQHQHLSGLNMPVTSHYVAPRAPIALCHGLYGFDKWGPDAFPFLQVRYWGGIEQALAKLGAKVIVTRVPPTGSIWERAQVLHAFMGTVLKDQNVNFVAHSMGGLDCRYLLSHIQQRSYNPVSLTTVSTPHRGSPVMDWFRDNIGVGVTDAIKTVVAEKIEENERLERGNGRTEAKSPSSNGNRDQQQPQSYLNWSLMDIAKMPVSLLDPVVQRVVQLLDTPAYANLTTEYCQNYFNPNTPDDPRVTYYSYGASTTLPVWSFLGLPNQWIREKEGDNDGLVSVKSAKWGQYVKTLNTDHWSLNGQRYIKWRSSIAPDPKLDKFDTSEFYMELATYLYHQGH